MIANDELVQIKGGKKKTASSGWIYYGFGIGAVISFVVGVVDGYLRPLACNK
jgi:hypothetical protein